MANKKAEVPALSLNDVKHIMSKHIISLFREVPGLAQNKAERNLAGRTHYLDDSIKNHGAKVHSVEVMDDGLILGIVESRMKGKTEEAGREFRPVFFDLFGNVIYEPEQGQGFDNQKAAMAEFWKQSNEINAVDATKDGAKAKQEAMQKQLDKFTELVDEME